MAKLTKIEHTCNVSSACVFLLYATSLKIIVCKQSSFEGSINTYQNYSKYVSMLEKCLLIRNSFGGRKTIFDQDPEYSFLLLHKQLVAKQWLQEMFLGGELTERATDIRVYNTN